MGGMDRVRKTMLAGVAALGVVAATPGFTKLALARDCVGQRCGEWKMTPAPRDPKAEEEQRKSLQETVPEPVGSVQELFDRVLTEHKVKKDRYFIEMHVRGPGIFFDVFEGKGPGRKPIGSFSIGTVVLQVDLGGVNLALMAVEDLINKRAFQLRFREELTKAFRLTEDK
jgi:hypothetical protein